MATVVATVDMEVILTIMEATTVDMATGIFTELGFSIVNIYLYLYI